MTVRGRLDAVERALGGPPGGRCQCGEPAAVVWDMGDGAEEEPGPCPRCGRLRDVTIVEWRYSNDGVADEREADDV